MGEKTKLIQLRKKRKLTQAKISEEIGVARTTYAGYEKGLFLPSIETANKIKKVLKCKDDDIFLN